MQYIIVVAHPHTLYGVKDIEYHCHCVVCVCVCVCPFLYSTLSLATECLKADFCRQLRAHGLVHKIMLLLKDAVEYPVSPDRSK